MPFERLRKLDHKLRPWKDPSRNFVYHDEPLVKIDGAQRAGLWGRLGSIVCLPDHRGSYQAYDERAEMVGSTAVGYMSEKTECPRFRKCDECPIEATQKVVQIAQFKRPE